ncbi:MAG: hypothetical protein RBS09_07415, partial [Anaerolineaceae bacterium]|nr:hypothetical protein [Anaerolineaceae bacterium]
LGFMNKTRSAGFGVGFTSVFILVILHLGADLASDWDATLDFLFWIIQLVLYFFMGMIAAKVQYSRQINLDDPLTGLLNASRGAGMIVSTVMWLYIFTRAILTDESGLFSGIGIVLTMIFLIIDFLIAIGLSSFGGSIVIKQHNFDYIE